jgi:formylglycine-generating enzyme required for sulfatase activity
MKNTSTGTGITFTRTGLVAAFLAAGVIAVEQSARADGIVGCWGENGSGQCSTPADLGACSSVAAGRFHTIALRSDGMVRCWGDNFYGQSNTPADLGRCSSVAGGGFHTIALRSDGGVQCWGYNFSSQCSTPADLGACSSVAGGRYHTIALQSDGNVRCWGDNGQGQCNTPADLGACSSVAGGEYHTVAVRIDGSVRCWGYNFYGQCNTPVDLGPCSSVAGGGFHTIALRSDGGVRCWGLNNGECDTPADLGACSIVAGGFDHSIALRSDGALRCWGSNDWGECIPQVGPFSSVAAGEYHTTAIAIATPPIDTDGDGRPDSTDNCPNIANSNQLNTDGDTRGDACDNCPLFANSSQADCNTDGIGDVCEIAAGAPDFNADTVPDTCQCGTIPSLPTCCPGDLDHDAAVGGADIGLLLSNWGPCGNACLYDLNNDDKVNGGDLGLLLSGWGPCPATVIVPSWATLVEAMPDPAVVTDSTLRAAITASGMAWRVRDTATQMEMLLVPPGTFQMGCIMGSNQYGCLSEEQPVHPVILTNAFYMGRYEVTQAQWTARMGSNPSYFQGRADSPSRPVEQVSWNTVQSFLSATGLRLPTEAEWEFACRAGTSAPFYNGSTDDSTVGDLAWYDPNSGGQTHAAGGRLPNRFGLYDMLGNVWEWVNDWYDAYPSTSQSDPVGPATGSSRVFRGGGWTVLWSLGVRSSCRGTGAPDEAPYYGGFRAARNP